MPLFFSIVGSLFYFPLQKKKKKKKDTQVGTSSRLVKIARLYSNILGLIVISQKYEKYYQYGGYRRELHTYTPAAGAV